VASKTYKIKHVFPYLISINIFWDVKGTKISPKVLYFSLWLYSPILGLGRLHETFSFISVTKSRTVGWTPRTGDQLVALGDCDDGEVGGMNSFGR
jgi:hypothetical protein